MAIYTHDCDKCQYLGEFENDGTKFDLYFCLQGETYNRPTVIARYGNDGPEYTSGMPFVGQVPSLTEAYKRAKENGLITTPANESE